MTKLKLSLTLFFFFGFILNCSSQTVKTIDTLAAQYQKCLDKGEFMLGCARSFYFQMDSMLNITYNKLRLQLDSTQKAKLKADQKAWLVKRDNYFKKTLKKYSTDDGEDEKMFMYEDDADFVKERVVKLIKMINN